MGERSRDISHTVNPSWTYPYNDTLVFSEDEKTLALDFGGTTSFYGILRVDTRTDHTGEKLPASSHNVYRSPSGKIISINVYGDNLNVSEVGKSKPVAELIGPEGGLGRAKAYAPTGHRIASADRNDNIHIWGTDANLK